MKVSGRLSMMGHGVWSSGSSKVSVIEIGEHTLRNVRVSDYLKNYLEVGDTLDIEVVPSFWGLLLVGVRRNGKTYVDPSGRWTGIVGFCLMLTVGFALIGMAGGFVLPWLLSVPFAYLTYQAFKVRAALLGFGRGSA